MDVRRYLVAYDITDQKRLRRIERIASAYGERVQYSLFQCDLQLSKRKELEALLRQNSDKKKDSVFIIDITRLRTNDIIQIGDVRITFESNFASRVI